MTMNPFLKVFIANGYYDLATPYFAADYTVHHLDLELPLQGNVTSAYYEAGHMMYIEENSFKQMKEDLANFIKNSIPQQ
jgi:carboxypeptidase C (cathepsin A)